jgi:hypothetical protein
MPAEAPRRHPRMRSVRLTNARFELKIEIAVRCFPDQLAGLNLGKLERHADNNDSRAERRNWLSVGVSLPVSQASSSGETGISLGFLYFGGVPYMAIYLL